MGMDRSSSSADCVLCCEESEHLGVWRCGHAVCWLCALRLRLVPTTGPGCPLCQVASPSLVIAALDATPAAEAAQQTEHGIEQLHIPQGWGDTGVRALTPHLAERCAALRRPHCPVPGCDWSAHTGGHKALDKHLKERHDGGRTCGVCVQGRPHVFLHEHTVYPDADTLRLHETVGQAPTDNAAFHGHPVCRFCNTRVYDNEALYGHMQTAHEVCQICDRNENDESRSVFYKDHKALLGHCARFHWACSECGARKGKAGALAVPRGTEGWAFGQEADMQVHVAVHHAKVRGRGQGQELSKRPTSRAAPARRALASRASEVFSIVYDLGEERGLEVTSLNEFRSSADHTQDTWQSTRSSPTPAAVPEEGRQGGSS
eukprot:Hpha_TRINITY_DN30056_c0_g1::TRINITY_DN30056_c0_g1_i1::g.21421::m.21421